ncbi:ureidoglycolate lyase [Pseudahrensia aquimaris]|uniref:Ureidoglycolate lyase n=1 Tax=Pseudahrensia aquimaris TaxID=744461 RepID=A0ABW3FGN4_9HYPH
MAELTRLVAKPLTREAFSPYGNVIETDGADSFAINNGTTERFHALAQAESVDGEVILSIFRGQPFSMPLTITMMERHPLGSQAFVPMQNRPWIVVVAPDAGGAPGKPNAFIAQGDQGVQYSRNVWHHPLISLEEVSDFLVMDRAGAGDNLEECNLNAPYEVHLS